MLPKEILILDLLLDAIWWSLGLFSRKHNLPFIASLNWFTCKMGGGKNSKGRWPMTVASLRRLTTDNEQWQAVNYPPPNCHQSAWTCPNFKSLGINLGHTILYGTEMEWGWFSGTPKISTTPPWSRGSTSFYEPHRTINLVVKLQWHPAFGSVKVTSSSGHSIEKFCQFTEWGWGWVGRRGGGDVKDLWLGLSLWKKKKSVRMMTTSSLRRKENSAQAK